MNHQTDREAGAQQLKKQKQLCLSPWRRLCGYALNLCRKPQFPAALWVQETSQFFVHILYSYGLIFKRVEITKITTDSLIPSQIMPRTVGNSYSCKHSKTWQLTNAKMKHHCWRRVHQTVTPDGNRWTTSTQVHPGPLIHTNASVDVLWLYGSNQSCPSDLSSHLPGKKLSSGAATQRQQCIPLSLNNPASKHRHTQRC